MKIPLYINPNEKIKEKIFLRTLNDDKNIQDNVRQILSKIKNEKDKALFEYCEKFDSSKLTNLYVNEEEFLEAEKEVSIELKEAIELAYKNIYKFHLAQKQKGEEVETMPGVKCFRKIIPIEKVGLYIPGGTAPLFSTVLMLSIPAKIAGCSDITIATPSKNGKVHPAILYTAARCGVKKVLKLGAAVAVAAFAYGSESVTKVDKIFGPGNRYFTFAKREVSSFCAIDMIAGPSEVLVIADSSANPLFVALDLLSQAEHGADSQVILVIKGKDDEEIEAIYNKISTCIDEQLEKLGRKEFMSQSLKNSSAIGVYNAQDALELSNEYAPEHLIINTVDADEMLDGVKNAGSVFLGQYSPESAGDYASGTNHTLPTSAKAKSSSGVSLDSFIKKITVQKLTKEGIKNLANSVITMAENEELTAHAEAAKVRIL